MLILQEVYSALAFGLIIGLAVLSNYFLHRLDVTPLRVEDVETHKGSFIAELAYNNLKILNDFGPKVVGSHVNEELAFNFVFDQVSQIRNASVKKADIEIDGQVVSGVVFGNAIYKNIQNVLVRVQGDTNHTVMLNCHFDSVPGSPGASDDIVMCTVMIELLRVISQEEGRERHSIVFLFNGSEEEDLQASHGFITKHEWAKDVRAYINLESTGSGGREILFRSGPKHDWLIRMYRQSAPRPFGHGVAEELFETGVIPSATDFEIFRDDGEVPGLDFAYVEDGWRYHTSFDSIDFITYESIQYTGENILALLKKMVNSDELADPPEGSFAVYYEYLGLFFISYTKGVGIGLNISISLLAVIIPFILQTKFKMSNVWFVFGETLISLVTILISTALSAGACILMAMIMNSADNAMSWHNVIFLSIGIYGSLALVVQIAAYHLIHLCTDCFFKRRHDTEKSKTIKRDKIQIQLNGVTLFWCILTLAITAMGYRFAYITMVVTFFALCTSVLTFLLCNFLPKIMIQAWILVHLFGHSFLLLWTCYMMFQVWELFLPITAKQYYENPDTLIALICTMWTVICFSYFVPLTKFVKFRAFLYTFLLLTFLVSLILSFTSVGFPYSDDQTDPRLQRFRVLHTRRTFYDSQRNPTFNETGFLISTIDRNSERTVNSMMNPDNLIDWRDDPKCGEVVQCGFPLYRFSRGKYLKALTQDLVVEPTPFNVIRASRLPGNESFVEIEFTLKLTTLTLIHITPGLGWTFINSTFPTSPRDWLQTHQFAKITYGKRTDELMHEIVTLEGTLLESRRDVVRFTIGTVESVFERSAEYDYVMEKFPDYTFAHQHQADVSSYIVDLD